MKQDRAFTLLLVVTIVTVVLVVLFNFVLRDDFAVVLSYQYPKSEATLEETPKKAAPTQPIEVPKAQEETSKPSAEAPLEATEFVVGDPWEQKGQTQETIQFPLELNEATMEQLVHIPKVGEVTATRIIQYRQQLGGYRDVSQLLDIKGIGEVSFETISAYVYVTGDAWDQARKAKETDTPSHVDLEGFNNDSNG